MASNLFGPGTKPNGGGLSDADRERHWRDVEAADKRYDRETAHAAGRDRRSIGGSGR